MTVIGSLILIVAFLAILTPATAIPAMEKRIQIERLLRSAYKLPYDRERQMTDVILMNAQVTDSQSVEDTCDRIIQAFNSNPAPDSRPQALRLEFKRMKLTPDTATIHLFRERTFRQWYRLDTSWQPAKFTELAWMDGQFTNIFPAYKATISVNPSQTGHSWTNFTVFPFHDHVVVDTSDKRLVHHEQFYLDLFGLPPLARMNLLVQTMSKPTSETAALIRKRSHDPTVFRLHKVDPDKLSEMLQGTSKFGEWSVRDIGDVNVFTFGRSDQDDDGVMRIMADASDPNRIHLAYLRSSNGGEIHELFAREYGRDGTPIRVFKATRSLDGESMSASVQLVVKSELNDAPSLDLFHVDLSSYHSMYDKRPENPVEIYGGKIVAIHDDSETGQSVGTTFKQFVFRWLLVLSLIVPFIACGWIRKRSGFSR